MEDGNKPMKLVYSGFSFDPSWDTVLNTRACLMENTIYLFTVHFVLCCIQNVCNISNRFIDSCCHVMCMAHYDSMEDWINCQFIFTLKSLLSALVSNCQGRTNWSYLASHHLSRSSMKLETLAQDLISSFCLWICQFVKFQVNRSQQLAVGENLAANKKWKPKVMRFLAV